MDKASCAKCSCSWPSTATGPVSGPSIPIVALHALLPPPAAVPPLLPHPAATSAPSADATIIVRPFMDVASSSRNTKFSGSKVSSCSQDPPPACCRFPPERLKVLRRLKRASHPRSFACIVPGDADDADSQIRPLPALEFVPLIKPSRRTLVQGGLIWDLVTVVSQP